MLLVYTKPRLILTAYHSDMRDQPLTKLAAKLVDSNGFKMPYFLTTHLDGSRTGEESHEPGN